MRGVAATPTRRASAHTGRAPTQMRRTPAPPSWRKGDRSLEVSWRGETVDVPVATVPTRPEPEPQAPPEPDGPQTTWSDRDSVGLLSQQSARSRGGAGTPHWGRGASRGRVQPSPRSLKSQRYLPGKEPTPADAGAEAQTPPPASEPKTDTSSGPNRVWRAPADVLSRMGLDSKGRPKSSASAKKLVDTVQAAAGSSEMKSSSQSRSRPTEPGLELLEEQQMLELLHGLANESPTARRLLEAIRVEVESLTDLANLRRIR